FHLLTPTAGVARAADPLTPVVTCLLKHVLDRLGRHRLRWAARCRLQDHPAGLPGRQRRPDLYPLAGPLHVAGRGQPAVPRGRNIDRHRVRMKGDAVVEHLGLVGVSTKVEAGLTIELEAHLAAHDSDHAYETMAFGDPVAGNRHEINNLADAVRAQE